MATRGPRLKPALSPAFCKGCGRCIDSCVHQCFGAGRTIHQESGLVPVVLDLERCSGCGLCFDACPEPFALRPIAVDASDNEPSRAARRPAPSSTPDVPDAGMALPESRPLPLKGMHASAIGAILAGCRHFFGYPITPSTEGAELMARLLPRLQGHFVQAVSEVAAINMMYGAGAASVRATTFTSSPGFSLMLEGLSYMIGAEVPGVVVNVMRGGPGLGNLGPEQADIKLACRGLGHGNTHAIVLAPATPQEMLDLTTLAFDVSFKYRNPVIVLADAYLGQMTGRVTLPRMALNPGMPGWAVTGDEAHRRNLISSIFLSEADLEAHNRHLIGKYERMDEREQRAVQFQTDDAEVLLVACNTPAGICKGVVSDLRVRGIPVGLFRPVTLWPFPIRSLAPLLESARRVIVVEAGARQLEDELRLAVSHAGITRVPVIERVNRYGGVLPSHDEIVGCIEGGRSRQSRGAAA